MKQRKKTPPAQAPASRLRAYAIATLALPVIMLVVLELALRLFHFGQNLDLFVPEDIAGVRYLLMNPDVKGRYFSRVQFSPNTSPDYFVSPKPAGTYRILALGGSTTVGFPYGHGGSFAAFLRDRLRLIHPHRTIEVINLGMTATNSYTTADIAREALEVCQPDMVIVYDGHNEFYGAFGAASHETPGASRFLVRLYLRLVHWKTFQLLRALYQGARDLIGGNAPSAPGSMMERLARGQTVARGDEVYSRALETFRSNIQEIALLCRERSVPLLLTTQVSNLCDQPPFVSAPESSLDPQTRDRFQQVLEEAKLARAEGRPQEALDRYTDAARLAVDRADIHFAMARCLDTLGRFGEAWQHYVLARDLDMLRFRTSSDFNAALVDAGQRVGAIVVDMEAAFRAASPDSLIGKALILEHLHPNARGYFLMAREYAKTMRSRGMLADPSAWVTADTLSDETCWRAKTLSPFAERCALRRVTILTAAWPFVDQTGDLPPPARKDPLAPIVEQVVQGRMTWEQGHVAAAEQFESRGFLDSAAMEYTFLVRQIPVNVSAHLLLGRTLLRAKDTTSAATAFLRSLAVEPTAYAYRVLGGIDLEAGRTAQAVTSFELAASLSHNSTEQVQSAYALAFALGRAGQTARAIREAERVLAADPQYAPARALLRRLRLQPSSPPAP